MSLVHLSLEPILHAVLKHVGMPSPLYELSTTINGMFSCTLFYSHAHPEGFWCVSQISAISDENIEESKNMAASAALDHLRQIYHFDILDYNYRELMVYRLRMESAARNEIRELKNAYQHIARAYTLLNLKYRKLARAVRRLKSVLGELIRRV